MRTNYAKWPVPHSKDSISSNDYFRFLLIFFRNPGKLFEFIVKNCKDQSSFLAILQRFLTIDQLASEKHSKQVWKILTTVVENVTKLQEGQTLDDRNLQ